MKISVPWQLLQGADERVDARHVQVGRRLDPPNLLLMDEPTTHLDMASIDALIDALEQYEGTLIFISHDVYFIRKLARHVLHVNAGQLTHYHGDYQYYLDKSAATSAQVGAHRRCRPERSPSLPPTSPPEPTRRKRLDAEARQARFQQRQKVDSSGSGS